MLIFHRFSGFSPVLTLRSTKKSVPISLLIMSRAFTLQAPDPAKALAQSISAMDDDVVTEVRSAQHRLPHLYLGVGVRSPFPSHTSVVFTGGRGKEAPISAVAMALRSVCSYFCFWCVAQVPSRNCWRR